MGYKLVYNPLIGNLDYVFVNNQSLDTTSSPKFANITDSGILVNQVVYGGTAGLLTGNSKLTYDGTTLILDHTNLITVGVPSYSLAGKLNLGLDDTDYSAINIMTNSTATGWCSSKGDSTSSLFQFTRGFKRAIGNYDGAYANGFNFLFTNEDTITNNNTSPSAIYANIMGATLHEYYQTFSGTGPINKTNTGFAFGLDGGTNSFTGTGLMVETVDGVAINVAPSLSINTATGQYNGHFKGLDVFASAGNIDNHLSGSFSLDVTGIKAVANAVSTGVAYGIDVLTGGNTTYGGRFQGGTAALWLIGHVIWDADNTYNIASSTKWTKDYYGKGKIYLNQTTEYITGSTNAGYLDLNANTGIRLNQATTINNVITATYFQTSTAITANSTGTVAIVAKDANLLTNNAGWLPLKKSDGTVVYVPYWT
jgi:hypothetical protein